jgi:hypothetical protein
MALPRALEVGRHMPQSLVMIMRVTIKEPQ